MRFNPNKPLASMRAGCGPCRTLAELAEELGVKSHSLAAIVGHDETAPEPVGMKREEIRSGRLVRVGMSFERSSFLKWWHGRQTKETK